MSKIVKIRFHWGHAVILIFALFGAFMAYFYINMTQEKVDLVEKPNDTQGQAFQEKINEQNQTDSLVHQAHFELSDDHQLIRIFYPVGTEKISIVFYRPSDSNLDQRFNRFKPVENPWYLPTPFLIKGPWQIRLAWEKNGLKYRVEERIIIPK